MSQALRPAGASWRCSTGEDYPRQPGGVPIQHFADPADAPSTTPTRRAFRDLPGAISIDIPFQLAAPPPTGCATVGEPYAMVVARSQAGSPGTPADLVDIELEELPCLD